MDSIHQRLTTTYASAYAPFIPPPPRRASTAAAATSTMPSQSPPEDRERRGSTPNIHHQTLYPVRTRSVGGFFSANVIFERDPASPPTDEDIIIVTVRLSKKERRNSFDDPLPDRYVCFRISYCEDVVSWRHTCNLSTVKLLLLGSLGLTISRSPPARGFFRRMSTRVLTQPSPDRYKAVKMPRGDYVRYFRHDAQGHYVGTEPEREWGEEEILEKYGQYQDLPLRSILGRTTGHDAPLPLAWGT
jgi:hypothetical protein